jgi:ribosomal protein L21
VAVICVSEISYVEVEMYAIIRTGGKQYRVEPGEYLRVERFDGDLGAELDLTDVMVVGGDKTFFGEPMLKDAKVTVVVTKQQRAPKVTVFKKKEDRATAECRVIVSTLLKFL